MIESIFSKPELFWFFMGLVLFLFELFTPGFFIFFFGLGAWVTALICLIGEPGINLQIIIFAVTSILSLIGLRRIIKRKLFYNKDNVSDEIEDEFTGKDGLAMTDFGPEKTGKVEFKGTEWKSQSSSEIKKGQTVIIVEKNNFTLIVEPKKQ
ncbi:MAG TPA: NfeD family protein [Bacteroidales bacterium]|nr:NfeD family protein [Bacteroidales bacterium]HPT21073.1 NfeD family protein [Bacteroidales bacterium]